MLLAIDVGNTNIVFALYDGGERRGFWRCATDKKRTSDEYGVWLTSLMAMNGISSTGIDGTILASVVPGVTFNLCRLCRDYFRCEPMVVGDPSIDLGIQALVDRPDEVGADRLVNAVGAVMVATPPLIVIDFGTATTFDVVDQDGNYRGGVIAPGINLSLEALNAAAAKLPRIDIGRPAQVIGRNTVACMQSGVYWGYVGLIEGLVARIRAEYGVASMAVVATGGLAGLFSRGTVVIQKNDEELTLRGLRQIYERNCRS
ncbi:Type III pantothenate kinase [uncultured Gammaproteobacteria bacterium]